MRHVVGDLVHDQLVSQTLVQGSTPTGKSERHWDLVTAYFCGVRLRNFVRLYLTFPRAIGVREGLGRCRWWIPVGGFFKGLARESAAAAWAAFWFETHPTEVGLRSCHIDVLRARS